MTHRPLVVALATTATFALAIVTAIALTPDRTLTFVDERSGISLTMQTDPAASDAGRFAFRVPSLGVYVGNAGQDMRVLTATSVVVNYSGPAVLRPVTDGAGSVTGPVRAPQPVVVRLQAQIDPVHRTAEATLTEGARRSHMVAAATGKAELMQALKAFESAMVSDDPATIYELMNSDIRAASDVTQFARSWRDQEARLGRISALRRTALSDPRTDSSGLTFAVATYTVTVTAPTGVSAVTHDAYFVRQSGGWKLWYTTSR